MEKDVRSEKKHIDLISNVFSQKLSGESFTFKTFKDSCNGGMFSQKDIIDSILMHNDTFAIIPTGGGKSLCFQSAALCLSGLTIVVTPLVALIADQVSNYNEIAIEAFKSGRVSKVYKAIFPCMNDMSDSETMDELLNPSDENVVYKLLYLSPERLAKAKFRRLISEKENEDGLKISQIVVDEAHCLSQWGFDFRESYLRIINFINERPKKPVISAFTATATPQDIEYIESLLDFKKSEKRGKYSRYISIVPRDNLRIIFRNCSDGIPEKSRYSTLCSILKKKSRKTPTIVYCTTVLQTEDLFDRLTDEGSLLDKNTCKRILKYHGQMDDLEKQRNASDFMKKKNCIMLATKAFGMGIDKDDIGLIIHYDMPRSLEDYYQEIGRAGRKPGLSADCYILYSKLYCDADKRGCLEHTIDVVKNYTQILLNLENLPIESRLTHEEKKVIFYLTKHRLSKVIDYYKSINKKNSDPLKAQRFIIDYLQETITERSFENIDKNLETDEEGFGMRIIEEDLLHSMISHLRKMISVTNDLHINNTKIANILRWHPDSYELNTPCDIEITEWKRKEPKYKKIFNTDIHKTTVFVRSSDCSGKDIRNKINYAWKIWTSGDGRPIVNPEYLFLIDSSDMSISGKVFTYNLNRKLWYPCSKKDSEIQSFLEDDIDIKGLFPKNTYTSWRLSTLESYLERNEDQNEIDDSQIPFVSIYGQRSRKVQYTIYGNEKLTYFDMCVADAIYSIATNGNSTIYDKTIWEVLSGDLSAKFSRADSKIKLDIENSINRMINTEITITDDNNFKIEKQQFLPLRKHPKGELGYYYLDTPPLYRYAEESNGEIISVPVSLLALHLYSSNPYKPAPLVDDNNVQRFTWKATIENAVLAHYLLHRISIYRRKKRGDHISFSTIRQILSRYIIESLNRGLGFLHQKIISILLYYDEIGFIAYRQNEESDYMTFSGYADSSTHDDNRKNRIVTIMYPKYLDESENHEDDIDHGIYIENGIKLSQLCGVIL